MSHIELVASSLALAYVLLAIREHPLCWPAAIVSSLLYLGTFAQVKLYGEAVLQLFFVALAIHGYRRWSKGQKSNLGENSEVHVSTYSNQQHLRFITLNSLATFVLGLIFSIYTDASLPYLDSAITCFSVSTTFLVAEKVLENWLYWIAIDLVAAGVYLSKGLYLTSTLYSLYVFLAIKGFYTWKESLQLVGSTVTID